jgi:hypothetical protein
VVPAASQEGFGASPNCLIILWVDFSSLIVASNVSGFEDRATDDKLSRKLVKVVNLAGNYLKRGIGLWLEMSGPARGWAEPFINQ